MNEIDFSEYNQKTSDDCLRCCLAALLGLPLNGVPNFNEGEKEYFWTRVYKWLNDRGLTLFRQSYRNVYEKPNGLYLCSGLSPRAGKNGRQENLQHIVVMRGNDMIFDPYPLKEGLITMENIYILSLITPLLTVKFKKEDFGDLLD